MTGRNARVWIQGEAYGGLVVFLRTRIWILLGSQSEFMSIKPTSDTANYLIHFFFLAWIRACLASFCVAVPTLCSVSAAGATTVRAPGVGGARYFSKLSPATASDLKASCGQPGSLRVDPCVCARKQFVVHEASARDVQRKQLRASCLVPHAQRGAARGCVRRALQVRLGTAPVYIHGFLPFG